MPSVESPPQPDITSWTKFHSTHNPLIEITEVNEDIPNKSLPAMPGEGVRIYDASDITGILPEQYEVVLRAAAGLVGVTEEYLGEVIENLERKLERRRSRHKGRGSQRNESEESDR